MQKTEKLTFQINKKKVEVSHSYDSDTGKPFKDQKDGLSELKKWVYDEIVFQQKQKGWCTYNNFESSFDWVVIDKNNNSVVYNTKADPVTKITEITTNDDGSKTSKVIYNKPVEGKTYALTGVKGSKCIANGNTWEESEVKC